MTIPDSNSQEGGKALLALIEEYGNEREALALEWSNYPGDSWKNKQVEADATLAKIKEALPSQEGRSSLSVEGWIAVATRMPEPGQTVLAYWPRADGGSKLEGWQFATAQCWAGSAVIWHNPEDDEDDYAPPSHWMPLPNPPEQA